ncbi:Mut7-C RNAse domain-containing protein [Pseudomonas zhanjiangensis]|uniref:Mut7-C RNAse domain-containing protein n=1 Tax=Pseudomonas zhanjiangensis TaxID=3239015 RepID=A0ABV3YWK6_9PSED
MVRATFRFYQELNDFLPTERRQRAFSCECAQAATTKHMIEALGVPHTEVELLLVNGESVGFDRLLAEDDRVAVYPKFESLDISSLLKVRERPLRTLRFIADAHLGGLARLLRMCGFDTLYAKTLDDQEIAAIAAQQGRIVLTRDRELLKRRVIDHGCYVRALKSEQQLRELFQRLDLAGSARPFSLCLHCNVPLQPVELEEARERLPSRIGCSYQQFMRCERCDRLFWQGSHWRNMHAVLKPLLDPPAPVALTPVPAGPPHAASQD